MSAFIIAVRIAIGAVASMLGVSTRTLRRWDAAGRLKPAFRTAGNHRRYDRHAMLNGVESLHGAFHELSGRAMAIAGGDEAQAKVIGTRCTARPPGTRRGARWPCPRHRHVLCNAYSFLLVIGLDLAFSKDFGFSIGIGHNYIKNIQLNCKVIK